MSESDRGCYNGMEAEQRAKLIEDIRRLTPERIVAR
jgi:hypothetical protein